MQYCERDCEEDEFEGHFFFSFFFFSFLRTTVGVEVRELSSLGKKKKKIWGRGGLRLGMMVGVRMEGWWSWWAWYCGGRETKR